MDALMLAIAAAILLPSVLFVLGVFVGYNSKTTQPSSYDCVKEFHLKFGHPAPDVLTMNDERTQLRVDLIAEELEEYKSALADGDPVGIADALGDLDYVVNGAAIEHGLILPAITREIHRSNMTKLGPDGKPIYREDGKILKGEGYEPPRLREMLESDVVSKLHR